MEINGNKLAKLIQQVKMKLILNKKNMTAFISSEVYKLYKLIETLLRYLVQKTDRQTN